MFKSLNIGIITKYEGNSYHGALINAIHQALRNNNANMFIINTFRLTDSVRNQKEICCIASLPQTNPWMDNPF
jgi:DNA-binding LacI/PurR family transcriptional regulator